MSLNEVVPKIHHQNHPTTKPHSRSINNNSNHHAKNANNNDKSNKRKFKYERGRKRSKSFSGCGIGKLLNPKPVLPSKFLLGGNINDPLNLNSLQDEEINRAMNAVTPKSSPIPTPPRRKQQIEVIIPPNINDPLNLIGCADDAQYEKQLYSPIKKGRKKRFKKRRTISGTMDTSEADTTGNSNPEARTPETQSDSAKIPPELEPPPVEIAKSKVCKELTLELSPKKEPKKRKSEDHKDVVKKIRYSMDKIVSPVVPQPGAWLKRTNSVINKRPPPRTETTDEKIPVFKDKNKQFQYGNYNRYYGYRNPNYEVDHRLRVFSHHPYLFEGKDILDIGCNIGHITLSVARDFGARSVTGIDIDNKLIGIARKNVKHYVKSVESPRQDDIIHAKGCSSSTKSRFEDKSRGGSFPHNVTFKQCNYVLEDDTLLTVEQPQFDVILCLSITKWIHLNWGDSGIKQAFRRMYSQLRPGGKLILEPQNWASYKSKRKLTEQIYKNFNAIEFFPDKFTEYLLSPTVGFAKSEILGYPHHQAKGFRRPIQVFTKSTMFLSERAEATPQTPSDGLFPSEKSQSGGNDAQGKGYVYSGFLERYCANAEENTEVNNAIGESLHQVEEGEDNSLLVVTNDSLLTINDSCDVLSNGPAAAIVAPSSDLKPTQEDNT